MKITIRPEAAGFSTIEMEHQGYATMSVVEVLSATVDRFAATIGLIANKDHRRDPDGVYYVQFTLGTGRNFIAFESLEG